MTHTSDPHALRALRLAAQRTRGDAIQAEILRIFADKGVRVTPAEAAAWNALVRDFSLGGPRAAVRTFIKDTLKAHGVMGGFRITWPVR